MMHGMKAHAYAPAGSAWHLISLRPQGQHDTLRSAAARLGARTVALSPWRVALHNDAQARAAMQDAATCDLLVFTSPSAAEAASRLLPLHELHEDRVVAVGQGTARALRNHGARHVHVPTRMDSEGLLALPCMQNLAGKRVALVTAPGGRGVIAQQITARGGTLLRTDVYERVPLPVSAATINRLQALPEPAVLAVSSGEALETVLPQLPEPLRERWLRMPAVVASERLATLAGNLGFTDVHVADGPMPGQLASAAHTLVCASAA